MSGQPLSHDEASWQAPRAQLMRLIDLARQIDARSIYLLTGGHGELLWADAAAAFCAAIAPCAAHATAAGIALLIEPASPLHADLHLPHPPRDTVTLADLPGPRPCTPPSPLSPAAGPPPPLPPPHPHPPPPP